LRRKVIVVGYALAQTLGLKWVGTQTTTTLQAGCAASYATTATSGSATSKTTLQNYERQSLTLKGNTTMAKIVLSMSERVAVIDLLRELLVPVGDMGFRYPPNWTDGRVAEKMGGRASPQHVAYLRTQMFGKLVPALVSSTPNNDNELIARVTALEEKLERLALALGGI